MAYKYERIVLAVDGSKTAEKAFHKAIDVAKRNAGTTLFIVHVIDTSSVKMFDMLYQNMYDLVHEHAKVLVDGYELVAKEAGVEFVETIIVKGTPKVVLTKQLGEIANADLIVCGKTGVGEIEQFFIGSTTEAIVRHATCDVLIVS
ncbi:MAG: universal stress protein [Solibacillus sp.]